ncbi:glycosyltransferase family 4 protein [Roseibium sp.]|uniref:glycosyltransferase family 4 protein n=1 Tax=Roseibium sp. TaxID=1936156 RepID=UPI003A976DB2
MTASPRRKLTFAFPGALETKTGGYGYDRRVIAGLLELGWDVELLPLGAGFPFPDEESLTGAERLLSALPDGACVLVDGLAFGVLDAWAARDAQRLEIIALVHHPLALETGLDGNQRRRLEAQEHRALSQVAGVIVTSPMTARELTENYSVPASLITVAIPGTDPAPAARNSNAVPRILSIGSLTARKGHDVLLAALKQIEDLPWSATIVGSTAFDPHTSAYLQSLVEELGLQHRVVLTGEVEDATALLATADIFALASRYEGYGMVFAEALAHGLPIVACHAGAVPDVVPEDAGLLVAVDDAGGFAGALRTLLGSPEIRRSYADASRRHGRALPGWDVTARIIAECLEAQFKQRRS